MKLMQVPADSKTFSAETRFNICGSGSGFRFECHPKLVDGTVQQKLVYECDDVLVHKVTFVVGLDGKKFISQRQTWEWCTVRWLRVLASQVFEQCVRACPCQYGIVIKRAIAIAISSLIT